MKWARGKLISALAASTLNWYANGNVASNFDWSLCRRLEWILLLFSPQSLSYWNVFVSRTNGEHNKHETQFDEMSRRVDSSHFAIFISCIRICIDFETSWFDHRQIVFVFIFICFCGSIFHHVLKSRELSARMPNTAWILTKKKNIIHNS